MANGFDLECPKCPKCGQQMQEIIESDNRGGLRERCKCKNPKCPSREATLTTKPKRQEK